ncbi:MAG: C-type lectin domain-containing protein [Steroidobacteraceae bacterium]|nr:C-type lectin domain-containing protein [Steroidobacteraceae bacterium]
MATITSSSEDAWVDSLRATKSGLGQVWIGGFQASGSQEPGSGWGWVNNEGPFPGDNNGPAYANWNSAEPNNSGGVENHLTLGRYGAGGGWNDEGAAPGSIAGFIVEYDTPRRATCTGTECQTIKGQFLKIPAEWIDNPDDTIRFSAYEFTDPRVASGKCGVEPLTLFGAAYDKPELRIPAYLCGSPKLVVVAVDGSDLNFTTGTVLIENDTATVLPGNNPALVCRDTFGPDFYPDPAIDPQLQDVVVYQTTPPDRMLENASTNPAGPPTTDPQFIGAAGEFTDSCGSSRGTGKETSYFVVGMHIDFGAAGSTPAGSHQRFVALTRYKLTLLQQSVETAKASGTLKNGDSTKGMSASVTTAITKLDRGDYKGALAAVQKFLKFVDAAIYTPVPENNYNGEHLMRGQNIEFTLRVKVMPYAP